LYANASGALDAPTTTELGNRADGSAGFNPDLAPERTWGAEVGGRSSIAGPSGGTWGVDGALFVAYARDLLLPFEIGDVTYYRNEGEARHVGAELALSAERMPLGGGRLGGALAATFTQGTFLSGPEGSETPEGNRVPGFPPRLLTWTLTWTADGALGLALGLDGEHAAAYTADSRGDLRTDAYTALHLRLALTRLPLGTRTSLAPFVSLRNATDARYTGSVVVNAFGGRFVEPASGRHVVAGLALLLD
jgi:iron complex outermembrane receptor protein